MNLLGALQRRGQDPSSWDGCHPLALLKGGMYSSSIKVQMKVKERHADSLGLGRLMFNSTYSVTLTENAVYEPLCTPGDDPKPYGPSALFDLQDPFFASTSPQMYAIATATVISYLLVIMLFITPRTFFIGGRGGGFLSRRGMISGSYGRSSVVGVGGRPWLQKIATLTVAISLTVVTADSFRVAKLQYAQGYMDSSALTEEVLNGLEIRIIRVVSGTFLWLAQVQTLIRLFPRHKEKVIIKWVGFALIVLDTIFTILNNFVNSNNSTFRPRNIVDAIPALNYLFDLSLSLLYAAWVIFYSLSKHRFAFFHVKMKNICVVALLSLIAIVIPITFFIVDISKPTLAAWGDYIRWVGAAAASVVVWEWVERIEALEREERKDGILGREIFDGDEMLDITPSGEADGPGSHGGKGDGAGDEKGKNLKSWIEKIGFSGKSLKSRMMSFNRLARTNGGKKTHVEEDPTAPDGPPGSQTDTPISRANSTASTAYRVRYHSMDGPTPSELHNSVDVEEHNKELSDVQSRETEGRQGYGWNARPAAVFKQSTGWLNNLFKRRRGSPPQEVATAQAAEEGNVTRTAQISGGGKSNSNPTTGSLLSLLKRDWAKQAAEDDTPAPLPVTVIPARAARHEFRKPRTSRRRASTITTATTTAPSIARQHPHPPASLQRHDSLPVMVIPARPRSSRTWSTPGLDESQFANANSHVADTLTVGTASSENPNASPRPGVGSSLDRRENNVSTVRQEDVS